MEAGFACDYLHSMSDDIRAELAELRDVVYTGFARMDRYFELQQAQFMDWRRELRGEVGQLRGEVGELRAEVGDLRNLLIALTNRVDLLEFRLTAVEQSVQRLDNELRLFRDSVSREFAAVRGELRLLRRDVADRDAALRSDVEALAVRVTRLEDRLAVDRD
jgi:chromosome segregation ATPase